ncbi:hypothetical protein [Psychrobacillus sp. OK032]|uniref:hypothetical protein n=1 Tax=Psychrobacillus sp. OK032 TaxID=1884358 RepID=UPI0008D7A618|nr:hypothetical protein [Psychrobacillus sp. OK032]SES44492.1 hypothetical protein SAMN05518872_11426 [Psychrobacillus sp. OK032]
MTFLYFIVGYCALYLVIWLHEVGHGIVYAKYKCKDNPFKVHVPFYLFFSTPQPVDEKKAQTLNSKQYFNIGIAGIIVNLLFGIPVSFLILTIEFNNSILIFFFYSFALFHLVKAASYLTISNIFLASDMITVQNYKPKLRIPLFLIGIFIVVLIIFMLIKSPDSWRLGYIISIIIMILCMGLGRIFFSRRTRAA